MIAPRSSRWQDKLRILFLSAFLPSPVADSAGVMDAYRILREISRRHEVTLLTFALAEECVHLPHLRELCCDVIAVPAKVMPGTLAAKALTVASIMSPLPAVAQMCDCARMSHHLRRLLSGRAFDLAHVEFTQMAHYVHHLSDIPAILDESDIAFIRRQRFTATVRSWPVRQVLEFDTRKLRNYELGFCNRFDAIVVRTETDRSLLRTAGVSRSIEVIPPWVDLSFAAEVRHEPRAEGLLFYAAQWRAVNEQAALYFAHEILPFITQGHPGAQFIIAGSRPSAALRRLQCKHVRVTGYLDQVAPEYDRTAIAVAPLLAGSGIKGKILHALACGKPVVTTTTGAEGIPAKESDGMFVRDDPRAFADCVNWLLDGKRYLDYAGPARRFIRACYDWNAGIARLEELYRTVSRAGRGDSRQPYPSAAANS